MKALGIECEPSELKVVNDGKQDQLVYEGTKAGVSLKDGLQIALDHAVRRLPIPKVMSYQLENGKTVEFVRPVKHLVALFDKEIVPVELFGLKAGRETMGHRFHVHEPISIKEAEKYAEQMEKKARSSLLSKRERTRWSERSSLSLKNFTPRSSCPMISLMKSPL